MFNPSINPLADFHNHWTAYEKAVALKDWNAALTAIEGAIRSCPIPGHLPYLSKERDADYRKKIGFELQDRLDLGDSAPTTEEGGPITDKQHCPAESFALLSARGALLED